MEPLVSIVIPIYNGEKYIINCVNGLKAQTYSNLEIILIDDGSKDQSGAICDAYAKNDDKTVVYHQQNGGLSSARNLGIKNANGKYVIFFDVDDMVDKNIIKDNVELAEENDADLVMFCFWYYNVDKKRLKPNSMSHPFIGTGKQYFDEFLVPTIDHEVFNAPWNKMIRKSILEKYDLWFDTRYPIYEDIIFASNLMPRIDKIVINNQMYYTYFVRSSGSLITKFYETFFESVTQFYKNAMDYCSLYSDNSKQVKRFMTMYSVLVIMHLKQISCQKNLSKIRKYELIERICDDSLFHVALQGAELRFKKRVIRSLINNKKVRLICSLYQFISK